MSDESRWDVLPTWAWARAHEFSKVVGGGTPTKAKDPNNYSEDGVPWITPADLSGYSETYISHGSRNLSEKGFGSCSARMLPKGSVLLSSRAPVGYCAVAANDICTNQGFKSFVLHGKGISPEYLRYYLMGSKRYLESESSGTTFLELSGSRAEQLLFPIAPANEQKRIVSKIDELFSRIDEGGRALERVSKLVERYRQSVLKAAVTGELTSDWREQRKAAGEPVESGEALLARILTSRRQAWEQAELAKMQAEGVMPTDEAWKKKYKQPASPDATELPELPEGWVWASVQQLCFVDTGATPKRGTDKYFKDGTIDWITSAAVNESLIQSSAERITPVALRETNAKVFPIGSLIVAMYGEGRTRGKVSELGIAAATNQACAALLCGHLDAAVRTYVRTFFEKNYEALRTKAAGGVQPNLNLAIIKAISIPLPPLDEIRQINEFVAMRLSQVGTFAAEFPSWSKRSSALRQRILTCAFAGSLVSQDPADEPASRLLERTAAKRAESNSTAPKRGRKKKTA